MCRSTFKLEISGLVQGVGFRPFIFRLVTEKRHFGEVYNDTKGVVIVLCCDENELKAFVSEIYANLPPLARIDKIDVKPCDTELYEDFKITPSRQNERTSAILSDFALCAECKKDFYEPKNPRFHYPFITCTHCGARFSLIYSLPYDRSNTTMRDFALCEFCKNEYESPENRRFHAQPISCPKCAIKVRLLDAQKNTLCEDEVAVKHAARMISEGKILAIKGVGGFHLICDAANPQAITLLRQKKHRPAKPLAILCKNLAQARQIAEISPAEATLLGSLIAPIVLLKAKIPLNEIAPDTDKIGIMLAYTPLQLLFFEHFDKPIIATSANLSGESIIYKDEVLFSGLSSVFDAALTYEREIENPSDDSVAQVIGGETMYLRTSRGIAPQFIELNEHFRGANALALGAELKNAFVIAQGKKLIISPFVGDLKSAENSARLEKFLHFFTKNYELKFDEIIADKHPNFRYPLVPSKKIQHHFAHICAVLFEHEIYANALAFAFDGTGYGEDSTIWGGEIFLANLAKCERVGHFSEFTLINADIKNAANSALSLIFKWNLQCEAAKFLAKFDEKEIKNLARIHAQSKIRTSSLGRLIDAFGAVIFGLKRTSYEAQMGLLFEKHYKMGLDYAYKFELKGAEICTKNAFKAALKDDKTHAVTGFLNGLADFIINYAENFRVNSMLCEDKISKFKQNSVNLAQENLPVVLCGGVFQNKTLLEILNHRGFSYKVGRKFPPNDSSIALGQMAHFLFKG